MLSNTPQSEQVSFFQWIHAAAFIEYHFDPVAVLPASNLQMNYVGLRGEVCMESPCRWGKWMAHIPTGTADGQGENDTNT